MRSSCATMLAMVPVVLATFFSVPAHGEQEATAAVRPHGDVALTILQTTDIHHHANGTGHLGLDVDPDNGTAAVGAYARIAAYVGLVRATAGHPVVLVDSGDWTMGTPYDLTYSDVFLVPGRSDIHSRLDVSLLSISSNVAMQAWPNTSSD